MWEYNYIIIPKSLKKIIGTLCPTFVGYTQNDSQELLSFILNQIHDEIKQKVIIKFSNIPFGVKNLLNIREKYQNILKDNNKSTEEKLCAKQKYIEYKVNHEIDTIILKSYIFWKKNIKDGHSIITDLFTGLLYSKITCNKCNKSSHAFELFTMIQIPTKEFGEITLEECLQNNFFGKELLNNENQYNCEKCGKVDAIKKYYLWENPEILIIHLKRFNNNRIKTWKTNSVVKFPIENLILDTYFLDIHKKTNIIYDLVAISEHYGSCNYGHYISHCKNMLNNNWYKFDDDDINYIPNENISNEIITKNAYILFYVLRHDN